MREPEVVAERFAYYLRCNPHEGRFFGVKVVRIGRDGRADLEEVARAARSLVMVRSRLEETLTP